MILRYYRGAEGMSEDKQQTKASITGSKYMKMLLVLIMALLLFGGPYGAYAVINVLHISYLAATVGGFAMLIAGLVLMWYLIRNKIIA
jgi:hypothetical protein